MVKMRYLEDVAYAALFLASDEARFITGMELIIDGGTSAGSSAAVQRCKNRLAK
jgi:NAD(P)-dependent dehydrogenase (short-subunit alcohol dehydrogenase family)